MSARGARIVSCSKRRNAEAATAGREGGDGPGERSSSRTRAQQSTWHVRRRTVRHPAPRAWSRYGTVPSRLPSSACGPLETDYSAPRGVTLSRGARSRCHGRGPMSFTPAHCPHGPGLDRSRSARPCKTELLFPTPRPVARPHRSPAGAGADRPRTSSPPAAHRLGPPSSRNPPLPLRLRPGRAGPAVSRAAGMPAGPVLPGLRPRRPLRRRLLRRVRRRGSPPVLGRGRRPPPFRVPWSRWLPSRWVRGFSPSSTGPWSASRRAGTRPVGS